MSKLVRNKVTRFYLSPEGRWTPHQQQAQSFDSVLLAIDRINQLLLSNCEIVFKSADNKFDLVLPVDPVKPLYQFSIATQAALENS